jgi:hypothetical protein
VLNAIPSITRSHAVKKNQYNKGIPAIALPFPKIPKKGKLKTRNASIKMPIIK